MLYPYTEDSPRREQAPDWDASLGFTYEELDAFWVSKWTADSGWEVGQLYSQQGATLEMSPAASVLHYGQALFEGLKARRTRDGKIVLFRPIDNARRMRTSAARLLMQAPSVDYFFDAVAQVVKANAHWVPGYGQGSLYIRPVLFGSGPVRGDSRR